MIGIERLRQGLRWDKNAPISPPNRPKVRIQEHCINMINAFAMSNFMPPSARDPSVLPERLSEKYKDFRDVARYMVLYPYTMPDHGELSYITESALEQENSSEDW